MKRSLAGRLLAHRGLWPHRIGQNSPEALLAAVRKGYGIETDLRDVDGRLVLSHDPARTDAVGALRVLQQVIASASASPTLALNVKADGILPMLDEVLVEIQKTNAFFFDMSMPQLISYTRQGVPVAVRVSEYEPLNYDLFDRLDIPVRVWLDSFDSDWWLEDRHVIELAHSSTVFIVSPELHGREPKQVWDWFLNAVNRGADVYLCTDDPALVNELAS